MGEQRLECFLKGLSAAVELAHRASSNGFLIEYIILAGSIIDAALRMALVLQHQLDTSSSDIPDELLYQGEGDKALSERTVYRRALEAGLITRELFERLQDLYSDRNKVVHRYIISDITTEDAFRIARGFEDAIPIVNEAVWLVEEKQIGRGVGMTRSAAGDMSQEDLSSWAKDKHGAEWLARAIKRRAT